VRSYIRFDPIGAVLAAMPWNFPFWQVFRFAAPALMAGNAGILKHASNVSRCGLEIEEAFREAGFPENLFRTVLVGPSAVSEMIRDRPVRAVTLTRRDLAGSKVAEQAGRELKKTVLELGTLLVNGRKQTRLIVERAHREHRSTVDERTSQNWGANHGQGSR